MEYEERNDCNNNNNNNNNNVLNKAGRKYVVFACVGMQMWFSAFLSLPVHCNEW
jgi:hypothetical protein